MAIKIADKFDVLTSAPIDSRMVVPDYQSMIDIVDEVRYEGMMVFVEDTKQQYVYMYGDFIEIIPVVFYDGETDDYTLSPQAVSAISNTITTDNLPEGTTNLYFTDASLGNTLIRQQFLGTAYNVLPNDHSPESYSITTNFQLMQIEADAPCRVRIYASDDGRNNDIARAFGAAVDPDNGMFVDFVITTPNKVYNIAPSTMVFSESEIPSSRTHITITNLDVTQKDINVTLTYVNFGKTQIPT